MPLLWTNVDERTCFSRNSPRMRKDSSPCTGSQQWVRIGRNCYESSASIALDAKVSFNFITTASTRTWDAFEAARGHRIVSHELESDWRAGESCKRRRGFRIGISPDFHQFAGMAVRSCSRDVNWLLEYEGCHSSHRQESGVGSWLLGRFDFRGYSIKSNAGQGTVGGARMEWNILRELSPVGLGHSKLDFRVHVIDILLSSRSCSRLD